MSIEIRLYENHLKLFINLLRRIDSGDVVRTFSIRKNIEKFLRLFSERKVQIVLLIFVFAFSLRLLCFGINPLVGLLIPDAVRVLLLSESLSLGLGFTRFGHPEDKFPPLSSLIIACSYMLGGISYQSALVPLIIIGSLTIIPVYLLGKRLFDYRTGVIAAIFIAVNPALWLFSGIPMSETIFTFFSLCALYYLSIKREKRNQFIGGILTGLAYLSRYVGVLIIVAYIFLIAFEIIKKKQARDLLSVCLWFIIGLLIVTFPWLLRNTILFGNPLSTRYIADLWRDPTSTGISAEYSGTQNIFEYLRTHSFLDVLLRLWGGLFSYAFLSVFIFPITILFFAIPGFYFAGKRENIRLLYYYLVVYMIFFAWYPTRYHRYLIPLVPLISIFAAMAISRIFDIKNSWNFLSSKKIQLSKVLGGFTLTFIISINLYSILLIFSLTTPQNPYSSLNIGYLTPINEIAETQLIKYRVIPSPASEEYVKAAEWLKDHAGPKSVVIAHKPLVFHYFSRLKAVGFPNIYQNKTLEYRIVDSNVSYLVLDSMSPESREYFPELYFERDFPNNFTLIYKVENPRTLIYYIERSESS